MCRDCDLPTWSCEWKASISVSTGWGRRVSYWRHAISHEPYLSSVGTSSSFCTANSLSSTIRVSQKLSMTPILLQFLLFLSLHIVRLIVFAESACRRRHLFLLSLENPYLDYLQIFVVCILALVNFFFVLSSFLNKIQDGRQNPMVHATAWTASSICFMFGLKGRLYSGRELKSFWCDSDNKNFDLFYVLVF